MDIRYPHILVDPDLQPEVRVTQGPAHLAADPGVDPPFGGGEGMIDAVLQVTVGHPQHIVGRVLLDVDDNFLHIEIS